MWCCSSSLPNHLCLPAPPPPYFFLTLKSFNWNSVMSVRCYVSHYMSVILNHIARFRCECSTVPSVSSLHISFSISLPEFLNKLEVMPAPFAPYQRLTVDTLDLKICVWACRIEFICNYFLIRWAVIHIYALISVMLAGCRHSDKW